MHTILGLPRTVFALAAIIVAIVLVVLIGLIILGSAAIRALMAPGVKVEGISLLALLVTIIVLLSAIFVLLLVLFWCCCKQTRRGKDDQLPPDVVTALLPLLPVLPNIRNIMRDVAIALYASGRTITWMHTKMTDAATSIDTVAGAADNAPDVNVAVWNGDAEPPRWDFTPVNPLQALVDSLRAVSGNLSPDNPFPLDGTDVPVSQVGESLTEAGRGLAKMAKDLGAAGVPADLAP